MSHEKPLHVQVAEALGDKPCQQCLEDNFGNDPWHKAYDTDWSATGPLIEKYNIALCPLRYSGPDAYKWRAVADGDRYSILDAVESRTYADSGPDHLDKDIASGTPLLAVCHLILALKEAGKL